MQTVVLISSKKAQFKIQQMAFMLVFVFIFFSLVGLFFLQINLGSLRSSAIEFERKQVLSALLSWSELPELSCADGRSNCIDEDKIYILGLEKYTRVYSSFWPVSSIKVYLVNTNATSLVRCPQVDCNYYLVYDSGQESLVEYAGYVSVCRTERRENLIMRSCEMGKLAVGVKEIPN